MNEDQTKVVSANWQGRSLLFNRANTYIYFPWFKYLVGEKPVKLYVIIGGIVGGGIGTVAVASFAYRLTSTNSVLTGIVSAFLSGATVATGSLMFLKPSRKTNLFVDSLMAMFNLFFPKIVIRGGQIKAISHDKIYFKDGRVGVMFLVSGTINPTTLLRHLAYTATVNGQLRTTLGRVKRYRFEVVDRVDFNEAKINYRKVIKDQNSSQLSRNIALIHNRHFIESLSKEVAKKSIELMIAKNEDELQRVYSYYEKAQNNSLIGNYIQVTGDRLKREVDML